MTPDEFNEAYPEGTIVLHTPSGVMTRTASAAGTEKGKAWVNLHGFAWSVELDEVEVLEDRTQLVCQRCGELSILAVSFRSYPGFDSLPGSIMPDADPDRAAVGAELTQLREENERLRGLLARAVRVEAAEFDGEEGCRFILGEDHIVAEWRGDGVATDTIYVEKPKLVYFETTTPQIRCQRMVLEAAHWEVLAALVAGPGDGELQTLHARGYEPSNVYASGEEERHRIVEYLKEGAVDHDCEWELNDLAQAIARGDHCEDEEE